MGRGAMVVCFSNELTCSLQHPGPVFVSILLPEKGLSKWPKSRNTFGYFVNTKKTVNKITHYADDIVCFGNNFNDILLFHNTLKWLVFD